MKRVVVTAAITSMLAFAATASGHAGSATPRARFLADLQRAVHDNDTAWLAAHISLPLKVRGRHPRLIKARAAFAEIAPTLIGPRLRAAVLAQTPDDLFSGWQGMMIGTADRNFWVYEDKADPGRPTYRIVGISGAD